jgi:hypothetical protein
MSKKKTKNKFPICPCCSAERHRTEISICLSIYTKWEKQLYKYYNELGIDSYNSFIKSDFDWACDFCLKEKNAILASLHGQNFSSAGPNLAYFDTHHVCRNCGIDFIFSKDEKAFWYEQLKFPLYSKPVNCLPCRQDARVLKEETQILSEILKKDEKEITIDELKTVTDIYRKWEKMEKVKFYEAMIRKKEKHQKSE